MARKKNPHSNDASDTLGGETYTASSTLAPLLIRRRIFRRKYASTKKSASSPKINWLGKFYGEYRSLDNRIRRVSLCQRHDESTAALDALIAVVHRLRDSPNADIDFDTLPEPVRKPAAREQRIAAGLAQQQAATHDTRITTLIARWKVSLLTGGVTEKHAHTVTSRAERAFTTIGATELAHVTAAAVEQHQGRLRKKKRGVQTCNHYLQACRQFCGWMIDNGLATVNPLARLRMQNVAAGRKHERRALTADELTRLISTTTNEPHRYNMTGAARALLYRTAAETGLRANELRHITVTDCELATPTPFIRIPANRSKRR